MKNKIFIFFKENYLWIISFFFFLIFLLIAHSIMKKEVLEFDSIIYNFINSFHSPLLTVFFKIITHFAGGYILIGICILVLLFIKKRRYFYLMSINLMNTILFNQGLKLIFARERPLDIALIEETGYSFPSGHSMASMSFYGLLIYIIYRSDLPKKWKIIGISLLTLLILLIGISRIYLGVHFVSDVIAGFCLSVSYLIIFTKITEKYLWREVNEK